MLVGAVSDTHGLLRPEACRALAGVDAILHAGDVGTPEVLSGLREIAPLTAVRGNVDRGAWADALPAYAAVELGGFWLYLLHRREDLDLDPAAAGFAAVLFGHSHRPSLETAGGVLYLNPGSAGPRRFSLPVSVARLRLDQRGSSAELVELPL